MFIRKFLSAFKVDDVNAKGRFIKVMNCESVIRLRATYQGNLVLDSDAKAGFDVQTSQPFDQIQITSETEQKLELWVSEHKLSYDALSTKANSSSSFLVEHYGESQELTPYQPSQSSLILMCDNLKAWIGGEGVTKETGIPLNAGEKYTHNSAAPLYAYIDKPRDNEMNFNDKSELQLDKSYQFDEAVFINDSIFHTDAASLYKTSILTGLTERAAQGALSPVEHKGQIVGIRNNDKRDLVFYDDDLSFGYSRDPNGTLTKAVLLSENGYLYAVGSRTAGGTPWKMTVYKDGIFSDKVVPESIAGKTITGLKIDPFTGVWWLAGGGVYFSNDKLGTVTTALESSSVTAVDIKFTETHVLVLTTTGYVLIINKETLDLINSNDYIQNVKGFYAVGKQWVFISSNYVYVTYDEFISVDILYEHQNTIASNYTPIIEAGSRFAVCGVDTDSGEGVWIVSAKPSKNVKAKFRVLRESF